MLVEPKVMRLNGEVKAGILTPPPRFRPPRPPWPSPPVRRPVHHESLPGPTQRSRHCGDRPPRDEHPGLVRARGRGDWNAASALLDEGGLRTRRPADPGGELPLVSRAVEA